MTSRRFVFVCLVLALVGCRDHKEDAPKLRPAAVTPTTVAMPTPKPFQPCVEESPKVKDLTKGDQMDAEWTPAEFKQGMARWKDTGVYLDGKPVGFLSFGELPIGLKPTWVKDKVSDRKRPGTNDPGWKWARQRFYKFTDYLKAIGIEPRTIKELHVYGPRRSQTLIVKPKDLMGPLADEFLFRFGTNTGGKAIPHAPGNFGNGKTADKLSGVMIYIKKKPPHLIRNEGMELDGVMQLGVPYYGDPIRGGVRIYVDNRYAGIIKRQELDPKKATIDTDGAPIYKMADVFAAQGIDTKKLVEAWVIRDDRREEKLPIDKLLAMSFKASSQAHGGVFLVEPKIRANAFALHSRAIKDDEIDRPTPDDE